MRHAMVGVKAVPSTLSNMNRPFFPCNLLCILNGIEIEPVSDPFGAVSWSIVCRQTIFLCLRLMYFPFSFTFNSLRGDSDDIVRLSSCLWVALGLLFHMIHVFNSRKIRIFIRKLNLYTSKRLSHSLCFLSSFFFTIHMIQAAQDITMTEQFQDSLTNGSMLYITSTLALCLLDFCLYDGDIISMSIYFFALLLFYNSVRVKTTTLLQSVRSDNYDFLLQTVNQINTDHGQFEALFNFNPIVWLIKGMCVAVITLICDNTHFTGFFILRQVCLVVSLFTVDIVKKKLASLGDQLIHTYSRATLHRREPSYHLCRCIDGAFKNNFTVWHMFTIDRSLIASYIGSVVTFSVLFVQIRNGSLQQKASL